MIAPKVSIVSVYYNRENYVLDSVQSLLDQTYDNVEIILVDDGSIDGTLKQLKKFSDPRIKVISQKNAGLGRALRKGIDATSGEYIAIHGSGDISMPERIKKQAHILDTRPNVGVVGCYIEDDNKTNTGRYNLQMPNGRDFTQIMLDQCIFVHGDVMFRRDLYDRVGGYRPFFVYSQDRDLWLRISEYCSYFIIEEVLYKRFSPDNSVRKSLNKSIEQARFSCFAVFCAHHRLKTGQDPIDVYGEKDVMAMMPRSKPLAKRLLWLGIQAMLDNYFDDGWLLISRALKEYLSLSFFAIYCIGLLHKNKYAWKFVGRPIYDKIFLDHLRRSGQITNFCSSPLNK